MRLVVAIATISAPSAATAAASLGPPLPVVAVQLTQVEGDQSVRASWTFASSGPTADSVKVEAWYFGPAGRWQWIGAALVRRDQAQSLTIPALEGYWAVSVEAANAGGSSAPTASNYVAVANPCPTAGLCVSVSTASPSPPPVSLNAQGFMFGLSRYEAAPTVDAALISPLKPQHWRVATKVDGQLGAGLGAQTTQVLNGVWIGATHWRNGGLALPPWENWNWYRSVIGDYVARAKAEGWSPQYWDVWNEPDGNCCPYLSEADWASTTTADILETFRVTYETVKAVDPTAKLIGPSLSSVTWYPSEVSKLDLETFLEFSKANGLQWAAVSWHENNSAANPIQGDISLATTNIADHVASVRRLLGRYPGVVEQNRIVINEYTNYWNHLIAGWGVGYARVFEDAGVAQASRSCWTDFECFTWPAPPGTGEGEYRPSPGGILGNGYDTRPVYWVLKAYADMAGQARMRVASSLSWQFDGIATRDDTTSTVRVLLGRHGGCDPGATRRPDGSSWCAGMGAFPVTNAAVTIAWPYGSAPVRVVVTRMPANIEPIATPLVVSDSVMTPGKKKLVLTIAQVLDGDAFSIVATPTRASR